MLHPKVSNNNNLKTHTEVPASELNNTNSLIQQSNILHWIGSKGNQMQVKMHENHNLFLFKNKECTVRKNCRKKFSTAGFKPTTIRPIVHGRLTYSAAGVIDKQPRSICFVWNETCTNVSWLPAGDHHGGCREGSHDEIKKQHNT